MLGSTLGATLLLGPGATRRGGCCRILFLYAPLTDPADATGPIVIPSRSVAHRSTGSLKNRIDSEPVTAGDLFARFSCPLFLCPFSGPFIDTDLDAFSFVDPGRATNSALPPTISLSLYVAFTANLSVANETLLRTLPGESGHDAKGREDSYR